MRAALPTFLALAFASPALAAPDLYLAWATSKWGTATTGSVVQRSVTWGEEADPDRDGIANLIEYACDTDPMRHNPASDCWQFFLPDSGAAEYRYPQITAHLRTDDPDLRVLAQTSQDLAFWSPQASSVDFSQPQPENPAVWEQATGSTLRGLRQMRYIDRQSMAQRSRAFMRLHVVRRFASASTTPIEPFAFTPGQTVATGSTARSSSITLAGFSGTLSASIPAGATLFVNGTAQTGSSATVKAGDVLWMQATAPSIAGQPGNYTLTIGGQSATWSFTAGSIAAVPDHPGTDSGYTPVETGVSDTGAAQISIPIVVAPGTAGMQPKLSIGYSSQGGNGPLGVGFSLSGLSTISRVGRTVAQDGVKGGVNFDANDRFALDGQRLIAINGADGADGTEYRLEFDPTSRIRSYGTTGSGPQRWVVETKAGLKMDFGNTTDSRFLPDGATSALIWSINKITDTAGNEIDFLYFTDSVFHQIQYIRYTANPSAGITYQSEVYVRYENRPDDTASYIAGKSVKLTNRIDLIESRSKNASGVMTRVRRYDLGYQQGEAANRSQLITVTETATDGTPLPATVIEWDSNGATGYGNGITVSADPAFIGTSWNSQWEPFASSPPSRIVTGDFNADGIMDIVHMNDHPAAFLPYSQYIAFGKPGGGFTFTSGLQGLLTKTMVSADGSRLRVGDFNGDGKSDLLHVLYTGSDNWVGLSNGDGSFSLKQGSAQIGPLASQTMQPTFASELLTLDINGDGRTDVVYLETGKMTVYVSNGNGSFTKLATNGLENYRIEERTNYSNWGWVIPGDFNGDGKADILYAYREIDTASPPHQSWLAFGQGDGSFVVVPQAQLTGFKGQSWDNAHPQLVSGDFNGDGLTDVFQMSHPATGFPNWVALSKGNGQFAIVTPNVPITGFNLSAQGYTHMQAADLNGDGLDDIFNADAFNTTSLTFIALSNGDGTFQVSSSPNLGGINGITYSSDDSSRILVGDFDGDGINDIFHLQRNHNHYLTRGTGFERSRVVKVTNGHGGYTAFDYKPLTDSSVYTKGSGTAYPCYELQGPMYVVSSFTSRNGIDGDPYTKTPVPPNNTVGTNTVSYIYEGAWTCLDGRGFMGFREIRATDTTAGIRTHTYYESSSPLLAGRVATSTQSLLTAPTGGSTLISRSDFIWNLTETTHATGRKTYFVSEGRSGQSSYEVNEPSATALIKSVSRRGPGPGGTMTYDSYGNLLESVVATTAAGETYKDTVSNTYSDTISSTKWHLGRLANSTVVKSGPNPLGGADIAITRSSSFAYHPTTGLLTQEVIEPSGGILRQQKDYTHDGFGNILTSTISTSGAASRTTTTTYTPDGRFVATTTNALNHTESKTYDPLLGNVLTQTGPNNLTTTWNYDAIGRPIQENRPDGTVTRSFYRKVVAGTSNAPPRAVHYVRVQSSGGAPKTVWYDLLDREIRADGVGFDGAPVYTRKIYNNRGELIEASQPYLGGGTVLSSTMLYDAVGREYQQTDPGNRVTKTTYDGLTTTVERNYNPAALNDFQKAVTVVNAMGWTVQSSQYLGTAAKTITRKYDPYGNLRFVTDPAGNTTELRYDVRGNKTWMSEPNSGTSTFTYNGFGELKTQTNAASQTTTLAYDRLGRVTSRTEPEGVTTFTYDTAAKGIGQLAREAGPGFERRYFYDALARPAATAETHGFHVFSTSRGYDIYSRPESVTYPSGFATRQVYNASGHLSEVQNGANPSTLYWRALQVNARGQVTQEALGNGIVTERAFEAETGIIQGITSTFGSSGDVQHLGFTFDLIGNLTERRDKRFSTHFVEGFGYDTLNRLQTVSTTGAAAVTCAYNDLGNLTSRSDVGTLTYASSGAGPHALTSVTGSSGGALNKTCGYDAKGNRTTDGGTVLDYSSFNKPTRIRNGGDTLSFDYGPDRALYRQTIFHTNGSGATSQTVREYIGGLYEREITSEGLVRHIHHIAGGNGVVAIHTDERSAASAAQRTRFIHKDHLGSVDAITDSNGVIVERQSYDAWGRRRTVTHNAGIWTVTYPATPGSAETHRGFTGHEMLDLVGLVHMGGRIYDPITARFLSPDPFVQSPDNLQNLNRYSYVLNNPLSYTDPSGFFFKKLGKLFKTVAKMAVQHVVGNVFGSIGFVIAGPAGFAAGYGFGSAFSGTLLAGGSVGDALRAGLIGGVSAGLTFGIGTAFEGKALAPYSALKPIVHGAAQGGIRVAQGGKFAHGFMSGAFASQFAGVADMAESAAGSVWAGRAVAAVVGGTAEVIGGGKFGNGAMTGAFGRMFNDEAHESFRPVKSLGLMDDIVSMMPDSWVEGIAQNGQDYVDAAQGAMEGWDPTVIGIKSIFNEAGMAGNRSSDAYFNGEVVGTAFGAGKIIKGAESAYKLSRLSVGKNGLHYGLKRGAWSNASVGHMWKDVREGLQDVFKEMVIRRYGSDN